jgi:probable rRNA maturation factor
MNYEVEIQNDGAFALDEARLLRAARYTLARENAVPRSAVTIVVADDDMILALNRQFRGIDVPTDVLSFPADAPPVPAPDEPPYLGDIVIAYPYAAAQALHEQRALDDSLVLLTVHGVLHLLGYDHDTRERRAAMWTAQAAALNALGVPLTVVPDLEDYADEDNG